MPGMFDDLIPQQDAPKGGMFDDLIPSKPDMSAADTAIDTGKSLATGVEKGAVQTLGGLGDIHKGAGWLAEQAGLDPSVGHHIAQAIPLVGPLTQVAPSTEDISKKVQETVGPYHKPESTLGGYAESVGEMAPAVLGGPGGLARRVATQAVLPGVASEAIGTAPGIQGTQAEPWLRAAASAITPLAAERVITPIGGTRLNRNAATGVLDNEGIDLTAGDRSGNTKLRVAEQELGGAHHEAFRDRQRQQYTQAALRRVGENAPLATPEVVDRAFARIGGEFDRLSQGSNIRSDQRLMADLNDAERGYNRLVGPATRANIVGEVIDDIRANAGNGRIPGDIYQAYRSDIGSAARRARNDPHLQQALYEVQGALDAAMERSLRAAGRTDDLNAWQQARRQYRNMLVIERAAGYAGPAAEAGVITPQNLARATKQLHGMRNYVRGQGDFNDLAHAGAEVLGNLPNSMTAARSTARFWPRAIGAAIGGLGGSTHGVFGAAPGAVLGGLAGEHLTGRYIMSPFGRAHLGNNFIPPDQNPFASAALRGLYTKNSPWSPQ